MATANENLFAERQKVILYRLCIDLGTKKIHEFLMKEISEHGGEKKFASLQEFLLDDDQLPELKKMQKKNRAVHIYEDPDALVPKLQKIPDEMDICDLANILKHASFFKDRMKTKGFDNKKNEAIFGSNGDKKGGILQIRHWLAHDTAFGTDEYDYVEKAAKLVNALKALNCSEKTIRYEMERNVDERDKEKVKRLIEYEKQLDKQSANQTCLEQLQLSPKPAASVAHNVVELTSATGAAAGVSPVENAGLPDGARKIKGFLVFAVKSKREHYRDANTDSLVADANEKDEITGLTFYTDRIEPWKQAFREFYSVGFEVDERELQNANRYQQTIVEKGKGKTSKITVIYCRNAKIFVALKYEGHIVRMQAYEPTLIEWGQSKFPALKQRMIAKSKA